MKRTMNLFWIATVAIALLACSTGGEQLASREDRISGPGSGSGTGDVDAGIGGADASVEPPEEPDWYGDLTDEQLAMLSDWYEEWLETEPPPDPEPATVKCPKGQVPTGDPVQPCVAIDPQTLCRVASKNNPNDPLGAQGTGVCKKFPAIWASVCCQAGTGPTGKCYAEEPRCASGGVAGGDPDPSAGALGGVNGGGPGLVGMIGGMTPQQAERYFKMLADCVSRVAAINLGPFPLNNWVCAMMVGAAVGVAAYATFRCSWLTSMCAAMPPNSVSRNRCVAFAASVCTTVGGLFSPAL